LVSRRRPAPGARRRRRRYRIGASAVSAVKRSANADREVASPDGGETG
jgi:hypothetical protein